MKHLTNIFLIIILFILSKCQKDDLQSAIVKAGVFNSNFYYSSDTVTIDPTEKRNWQDALYIDLNNDGNSDITIRSTKSESAGGFNYISEIFILDSTFQFIITTDSISPKILCYNDSINENQLWSYKPKFPYSTFKLALLYEMWALHEYGDYTYWLGETGYIGVRNEYSSGKYKYGWIKIYVESYLRVILFEYAYTK